MKVLFVFMGAESLGVEYLAACVRQAGHEADLAFDPAVFGGSLMWNSPALAKRFDLRPRIIDRIIYEKPDVAAFSCFTGNYLWSLSVAAEVKKKAPGVKTIFGGVHVTAAPHMVIDRPEVDCIIVGEADSSFPALLDRWENGGTGPLPAGVWEKTDSVIEQSNTPAAPEDLNALPLPAKELFYNKAPALERHYMIMSARGCPFSCTYCYKSLCAALPPGSPPVRKRSVDNVMSELEWVKDRGRAEMIVFRDDVFTLKRKWLEEFTEKYVEKINLPYFCYTHPKSIDEQSADLIKAGGCTFVTMGVQSVDEQQRREILNRKYTNDHVRRAVALLRERKISISVDHIAGIPGDDIDRLHRAAEFYNELRPERLLTFWLEYFPGTKMVDIAIEKGLLTEEDKRQIEQGHVGFRYSGGGSKQIDEGMKKIVTFFSMIPLLPQSLVSKILKKKSYLRLPGVFWLNNIMLFLNAVKTRDPFFFYNLKFMLSRKKVP